jgi:uncharacterized damage-inducible protein DinB
MINQTPWIERRFNFDFPVSHFPVIFSRLEGSLFRLQILLQAADEEQSEKRISGWSLKEQVGHLYDLESLWWQRLNDFNEGKEVLTAADITNQRTTSAGHNEKALEQLLYQFVVERQKMLEAIYEFDAAALERVAIHPRLMQPMRLIDALFFVAEHDDHHISIISNMLRKDTASVEPF